MKQFKRLAVLAVGLMALLVPATAATAATAPGYEQFSDCPDKAVDPAIVVCAITEVTSGHIQMGTKDTPITDPIEMVLGIKPNLQTVVGSFDGGRQRIPGGLVGLTGLDWLRFIYPLGVLQVYAEAELAGPVTNPLGTVGLPLKVHLDNLLLSNNCYIGSDTNPISLNLRVGTTNPPPPNQPITGQAGTLSADPVLPGVFHSNGIKYVDNEFAAPAATNCDLLGVGPVTALVNLQAGLPSPAGTNETIQNANITFTQITRVYPPSGIEL
jgi:hypothetical protein